MSNNQDPWGQRKGDGPPDLFQLLKKIMSQSSNKGGSPGSQNPSPIQAKKMLLIIPLAVIALWFVSGFFVVNAQEQAVITRFGRYVDTLQPGLHWIPRIIQSEQILNVQRIRIYKYRAAMLTVDTDKDVVPSVKKITNSVKSKSKKNLDSSDESANDISIVVAEVTVNYRIAKPENFLFNTSDPVGTLQQATSSALRQEVGHMQLESVLSTKRELLRLNVAKQLRKILSKYNTGIEVTDVTIQKTETPDEVRPAFLDVIKAQGEKNAFINMAEAYAAQQLQTAQGASAKLIAQANAYKSQVVNDAKGQIARYNALLSAYDGAPEVTKDRLYFDAMQNVLDKTTNIVLSDKGNNLLYLPIDQLLKQRHATAPASTGALNSDTEATLSRSDSGKLSSDQASASNSSANDSYGATSGSATYTGGSL